MNDKNIFHDSVISVLREFKFEFSVKISKLKIPIYSENKIIAFLNPISENFEKEDTEYVKFLSEWRAANWQAYPTVFKVTEEGTRKWIKEQLIYREDRILFVIMSLDNQPVGHLGLSNFDFVKKEAEIDNVVRGVQKKMPGIMQLSFVILCQWAFTRLGFNRLFLRVFLDNSRAIKLYERCGFKSVRKIPLHKTTEGEVTTHEEITKGENLSVDRIFLLMELYK